MSKILEEYERVVAKKKEEKQKRKFEEFMKNAKESEQKSKIQPLEIPDENRELKWEARENFKEKRPKITEKAYTIVPKKQKRDFRDTELEETMGKKADVKYLDEAISKRFVCDGATLICKHLKFAERLILRVTDKGARLQGGNPIATEDDVLPENFEFQYSAHFTNDNFGNSNGIINEKTKGLCDATGSVCVIQSAYWTKMATSILNNEKAMIFDTSELYCAIDESSPITVEYNGQDFSEFEGQWNSITHTHKNNPVMYNFTKSALLIYLGDYSQIEGLANSTVSYFADEEVDIRDKLRIGLYSEIGWTEEEIDKYKSLSENLEDYGEPIIEGLTESRKELKKLEKDVKVVQPSGLDRKVARNQWKKAKKMKETNSPFRDWVTETAKEKYKNGIKRNVKNIRREMGKNLLLVVVEKGVDKVMVDYNSFIPTEARYNQSIDYFNKVYYIEDYTKKAK